MMKKDIRTHMACAALTLALLLTAPALAGARSSDYNKVGFASMNLLEIKDRQWRGDFHDLAESVYEMQYNSFKRIVSKMQRKDLQPASLIDPGINARVPFMAANKKEVNAFHQNLQAQGDRYLYRLAQANDARLIVTARIKERNVNRFIAGKRNLLIAIIIYDLNSNTIGTNYVPLTQDLFFDLRKLMRLVGDEVIVALNSALVNVDTVIETADTGFESTEPADEFQEAPASDDGYWE